VGRKGHANVPFGHVEAGRRLAAWVSRVRHHREDLSADLYARLATIKGWTWDARTTRGQTALDAADERLVQFVAEVGHACVPQMYKDADGFGLGAWVTKQRRDRHALSRERQARLTALAGWSWSGMATRSSTRWQAAYERLTTYVEREGTALMPQAYKSPDGYCLGSWVHEQRASRNALSATQRRQLEQLAGWTWNVRGTREGDRNALFAKRVASLAAWAERHGNACPPSRALDAEGFRLGEWITYVRARRDQLTPEQQQALESVPGWSWTGLGRGVGRWRRQAMGKHP
jgi:hypothetical protein